MSRVCPELSLIPLNERTQLTTRIPCGLRCSDGLHETALVSDEIIPTMAGALTRATLGQHPVRWRERFGPIPDLELLPWTYTTAFLAHLVDEQTGRPGSAISMAREYCASAVPDDPSGILGTPGSD